MGALILVIWVISRKEAQGSGKVPACSNLMPGNELSIGGKTKTYNMCHITVVFPQYKMVAAIRTRLSGTFVLEWAYGRLKEDKICQDSSL